MFLSRSLALLATLAIVTVPVSSKPTKKPWKIVKQPWYIEKSPQRFFANDPAVKLLAVECYCSPSKRGHLRKTADFLFTRVETAHNAYLRYLRSITTYELALLIPRLIQIGEARYNKARLQVFNDCWPRWGAEACVNADAANRARGAGLCNYVKGSGKTVADLKAPRTKRRIVGTTKSCRVTWPSKPWALPRS